MEADALKAKAVLNKEKELNAPRKTVDISLDGINIKLYHILLLNQTKR